MPADVQRGRFGRAVFCLAAILGLANSQAAQKPENIKVYALDAALNLKPGASKKNVEAAMEKHVVAQGQLMGTYKRK